MVAVLADTRYRFEDQDEQVRPPLAVVGSYPRRTAPAVSPRVAARRRLVVGLVALVVAVVGVVFALQAALGGGAGGPLTTGAASAGASRPAAAHAWLVRPGDTLWSIAVAVHPHGDVRPLVDHLSAQVGGRPLMVGERLTLPLDPAAGAGRTDRP